MIVSKDQKIPDEDIQNNEEIHNDNYDEEIQNDIEEEILGYDSLGKFNLPGSWFKTHLDEQISIIGKKYIPGLHVEGYADLELHYMLGHQILIDNLKEDLNEFIGNTKRIEELFQKIFALRDAFDSHKDEIRNMQKLFVSLSKKVKLFEKEINIFISLVQNYHFSQSLDFKVLTTFTEEVDSIVSLLTPIQNELNKVLENPQKGNSKSLNLLELLSEIITELNKIYFAKKIVLSKITSFKRSHLVILGEAGMGKTHLICHFIKQRIDGNKPAILLLGIKFNAVQDIFTQIKKQLNIPDEVSWSDFIDSLETTAKKYKTRLLFIIDAINESDDITIWKTGLQGLLKSLTRSSLIIPVITCRESYRNLIWGDVEIENKEYVLGFGNNQDEALKRYFEFFKINPRLSFTSFEAFSHPLYIRIFCSTYGDPSYDDTRIIDISGQNLYKVFDEYIEKCNKNIFDKYSVLGIDTSGNDLKTALMRLSSEIWHSGKRYVGKDKAKEILDPDREWETNLFKLILEEDLLLTKNAIGNDEIVDFTFDLMGDYLLAQFLLEEKNETEIIKYLTSSKEFSLLINDKNRPRRNGILRCIAIMLPEKINKHFFEVLPDSTIIRNVSESALFEIDPKLINKDSVEWLAQRFRQDDKLDKQRILKRLSNTVCLSDNPLNAKFTYQLLRELSKVQRDLIWSEWIRKESTIAFELLKNFESVCSQEQIDSEKEEWLTLTAQYIVWLLSTTNKELRDRTTRALYKFGCKYHNKFFGLCEDLFSANDPFIVERILAAAYGVAMASPKSDAVQQFSIKIFENFFKEGAPNATTHLIIRDYVRHIIMLVIYYKPSLYTAEQKAKIEPPFKEGGIRNWKDDKEAASKLTGDRKAALGFGPVDKEFARDMVGNISSERSFRSNFPTLKESMAKLIWRVKELGYDSFKFHEIDKNILHNLNNSKNDLYSNNKFERYNRKYCWIALLELAGFYADTYDIIDEKRNFLIRTSDIDIDPSFPELPTNYQIVDKDFLGDRELNFEQWINSEYVPKMDDYLQIDEIAGQKGPWVLLDGYIFQEDTDINRGISVFPRGLFFEKFEAGKVFDYLEKNDLSNIWFPEIPHIYTTFAGEIPWCETFLYNGMSQVELIVSSQNKRVPQIITKFLRGEEPLNEEISFRIAGELALKNNEKEKEEYLNDLGVRSVETEIYHDIIIHEKQTFDTFIPVVKYSWDSRHSTINPGQSAYILSKDISESLGLVSKPQTFSLFDSNGQPASFTIKWGGKLLNSHQLIYIRKDLLDKYLEKNSLSLIWTVCGEKEYRTADFENYEQFVRENKSSSSFQNIAAYNVPSTVSVKTVENKISVKEDISIEEESSLFGKIFGRMFSKKKES